MPLCPLCKGAAADFHQDKHRAFLRCEVCALIFAHPDSALSPAEEKSRYELHQNHPDDPRYRRFLSRLVEPLAERLDAPPLEGLDFGCGPGPTLSVMMEELGYRVALYDPFFAPAQEVLKRQYNFITCTEAIEHFNAPAKEWRLLLDLLEPGGWLGLMTKLAEPDAFARWHYKFDPTHVSFFSRATFRWLAQRDRLGIEFVGSDVILLRKLT